MRPARGIRLSRSSDDTAMATSPAGPEAEAQQREQRLLQAFAKQTECGNDEKKLAGPAGPAHIRPVRSVARQRAREEQPEQKAGCALDRQCSCLPKSMQDAGQCGGGIEQRAEQRKVSRSSHFLAVKEQPANDIPERKEGKKKQAEQQASENEILETETMRDSCRKGLCFRDERKKEHAKRTGDSCWKQKQWQYHSA
ncbi:MAG: hypothetical protein ACLTSZ_16875 [Lachnospiraceae bacterium]